MLYTKKKSKLYLLCSMMNQNMTDHTAKNPQKNSSPQSLGLSRVLLSANHSLVNPLLGNKLPPRHCSVSASTRGPQPPPAPDPLDSTAWLTISSFDLHLPYGEGAVDGLRGDTAGSSEVKWPGLFTRRWGVQTADACPVFVLTLLMTPLKTRECLNNYLPTEYRHIHLKDNLE